MNVNIVTKKTGYSDKNELIHHLEETCLEINKLNNILKKPIKGFKNQVLVEYIVTQSTVRTKEFVNKKGKRTPKGTKYTTNDISELIRSDVESSNLVLLQLARSILQRNVRRNPYL